MEIEAIYATKTFKLIVDFELECRVIDMKRISILNQILLDEVINDINLFTSVRIDASNEEIYWKNGLRITHHHLYQESTNLEDLLNPPRRKFVRPLKVTTFTGETKIEKYNNAMLEKIKSLRYK